jgi:hypothetical protein
VEYTISKVRKAQSIAVGAALLLCAPASLGAHDIPSDVTVQTFVRPEGHRLHVLVRVPLAAMRDMDYPKRGASNSGLVDLARADATLRDAATLWVGDFLDVYEDDRKLAYPAVASVRAALQSDASFASFDSALAHVTGARLPDDTDFVWAQGLLDILFEYPIQSEASRFSINPRFARLGIRTLTVVRFVPAPGSASAARAFELQGDPGLVRLDPQWQQAARQFVELGFARLLNGTDVLLFLLCLVMPFRRLRSLVAVVTSFTVAHSIALIASAYNFAPDALWFPPLIDTLIAVSILYMAVENIFFQSGGSRIPLAGLQRRWLITFGFGLVHGFGLSLALRPTLQFAGTHLLASVLSFNIGVEIGQLLVLVLMIAALDLVFRFVVPERLGTIIVSALVGHTAWHSMTERWDVLRRFRFEMPAFDLAFWAGAMRWAMLLVAGLGLYWLMFNVLGRPGDPLAAEKDA